jgi:UDP-N-acetylmuramoyl-tripeptide--D-alanyl-D-alanine ligase
VVKTAGNNNTNMGVARTILRDVNDEHDFFICEMGAYRVGEIKEICSLALPSAGIVTGLNEQHIELFGSLENIKRAKFELIRALPQDGFAVISRQAEEMNPKMSYNVRDVSTFSLDLVSDVEVEPEMVTFRYKDTQFRLNILGKHYIENLLAAIITAEKLGMSLTEIQEAVERLDLVDGHLMQKRTGPKGAVFIDDSYSGNPSGVTAALEYLQDAYADKKKMLVFPGIIELGKSSRSVHEKIWRKCDEICYFAFLLQEEDQELPQNFQKCHFVFEKDFDRMKKEIEKRLDAESVVLFESRGAGVVMRKILDHKEKRHA